MTIELVPTKVAMGLIKWAAKKMHAKLLEVAKNARQAEVLAIDCKLEERHKWQVCIGRHIKHIAAGQHPPFSNAHNCTFTVQSCGYHYPASQVYDYFMSAEKIALLCMKGFIPAEYVTEFYEIFRPRVADFSTFFDEGIPCPDLKAFVTSNISQYSVSPRAGGLSQFADLGRKWLDPDDKEEEEDVTYDA